MKRRVLFPYGGHMQNWVLSDRGMEKDNREMHILRAGRTRTGWSSSLAAFTWALASATVRRTSSSCALSFLLLADTREPSLFAPSHDTEAARRTLYAPCQS